MNIFIKSVVFFLLLVTLVIIITSGGAILFYIYLASKIEGASLFSFDDIQVALKIMLWAIIAFSLLCSSLYMVNSFD